ncbi:DUF1819 family protein [Desulforhopalus vacuolatus]|uniref:DUF1819 family protein n=1 Tax=Desulforhopalus vacuolatus TaxID=40414 RepID=UPI001966A98A|nr:DUF1819 family protein [Desulforhopalus vacuolatus]MBM9518893.1 DUF1819 family protein [Desulforhopalus vacuolatus]
MTKKEARQKRYNGEISAGSLLIPESRKIAALLLRKTSAEEWYNAVVIHNVLQKRSPSSAQRQAVLIRNRLQRMTPEHWVLVKEGNAEVTTQALLASAVKQSHLLSDFMENVCRQHWLTFNPALSFRDWQEFLETCALLDPSVETWTAKTTTKLRQVVFRMLAEAGYIDTTKKRNLQPVSLVPEVVDYLVKNSEDHVLRCMECTK